MTDDTDTDAWIESQPIFIASQLRPGHTLTDADITAIQSVLSEIDKQENDAVEVFQNGRMFGLAEIGGQELVDAVERKDEAWLRSHVRKAIDRMDEQWGRPTLVDELRSALIAVTECKSVQRAIRIAREMLAKSEGL